MATVNKANDEFFLNLVREGVLEVSRNGRVFNTRTQQFIGYITNKGYRAVGFKKNRKVWHILVHRLVWLVHVGPIPEGLILNHKNGCKLFNSIRNLECVTYSVNNRHAYQTGLKTVTEAEKRRRSLRSMGHRGAGAKLTPKDVRTIRRLYRTTRISQRKLGAMYNIAHKTINAVVNMRSYKF